MFAKAGIKANLKNLNNWDLDIKNPNKVEEVIEYNKAEIIEKMTKSQDRINQLLKELSIWVYLSNLFL